MYLLDGGLTRPLSNTSPTICGFFTLKSGNPVLTQSYQAPFFCHFLNTNVVFVMPTQFDNGNHYFMEAPSLGDCQPRLKSDLPAPEIETIPH